MFSNLLTWWAVGLAALAGVTWWVIRKRLNLVWLPILSILRNKRKKRPKIHIQPPNIVRFICFALLACCLVYLTLRPTQTEYISIANKGKQLGIVVDLSPSVSANISLQDYKKRLKSFIKKYQESFDIFLTSSADDKVIKIGPGYDSTIDQMEFQKLDFYISDGVSNLLRLEKNLSNLVIFSDRDQNSWASFQWKYFVDKLTVDRVDLSENLENNFFWSKPQKKSRLSDASSQSVRLAIRSSREGPQKIRVKILNRDNQEIFSDDVQLNRQKFDEFEFKIKDQNNVERLKKGDPLTAVLVDADSLQMDNKFYFSYQKESKSVGFVSASEGERFIESDQWHLLKLLQSEGFEVDTYSKFDPGEPIKNHDFWIIKAGSRLDYRSECQELARQNLAGKKIWVIPFDADLNLPAMCHCVAMFVGEVEVDSKLPPYCQSIERLTQLPEVLRSIGGKQLGGEVGQVGGTMAWHFNQVGGVELTAFTVPLSPSALGVLDHGKFALVVHQLLGWQGLGSGGPRNKGSLTSGRTNVSSRESMLASMKPADLPPTVGKLLGKNIQSSRQQEKTDPSSILLKLLLLGMVIMGMEIVYEIFKRQKA